ncbi:hypothetical protein HOB10_05340 [Candidatus Parcubacteria bacterium]|jgi:cytoskeletal protein RodZ|nr:hypothetical protein [Candidatus Parcubacteria bacterium]
MQRFKRKQISKGQTLGDKLKQVRLDKELSLEDVYRGTSIQIKYLEILESGDYHLLPGNMYAKAWIKLYAEFLEIPSQELLFDYKVEKNISDKISSIDKPVKVKEVSKHNFLGPKTLKVVVIALVVGVLLGYLGWELYNIVAPPKVVILEPGDNFRTTESSVLVKGQTQAEVQLTINNETVLLDHDGNFSQVINLIVGLNNLQISAKKKHSKTNVLELDILREVIE